VSGFVRAGAAAEVPEGAARRYVLDGVPVAVYRCRGRLLATHDRCTHAEASLSEGFIDCDEGTVECPLHGARFDIASGKALSLPAVVPVKTFAVKEEGGDLFVAV
jgi:nitrite reductase/ring-hydroxylating ferredoxin subunit